MRFVNEIMMIQEGVYVMSIYSPRVSKMQKCFSSLSNFRNNSAKFCLSRSRLNLYLCDALKLEENSSSKTSQALSRLDVLVIFEGCGVCCGVPCVSLLTASLKEPLTSANMDERLLLPDLLLALDCPLQLPELCPFGV